MTKPTVTRLFVGGVVTVIAGVILAAVVMVVALANDVFAIRGPDIVDFAPSGFAWSLIGLAIVGGLTIVGGAIAGLVAWIGALLNTVQLEDKTWFVLLLVLGLLSFGFVAMIAYVIAGPDGTRREPGVTVQATW